MGWENRKGQRDYYRKRREGDCVVSEYVGRGLVAEMAADIDKRARSRAQREREDWQQEIEGMRASDAEIDQACALIDSLVQGTLLAHGFHTHRRQWRKKRGG